MLPTFVIGLREGLEAALIVGILAAFLRKQQRRDLLRWMIGGVGAAVLLCLAVGIALELYSRNLPQRRQEGLETVIGALAVGMVTYMVVWMRRHSRELKGQLEGLAAGALSAGSGAGRAMVLMAFLAVIREGLETVVFLLAAFNESGSGAAAGVGALLGIAVAVGLGYGIYRGGVRLNLSKFFRATGLVLVLVAAGLVVNALHTAHEAGWLNAGQGSTVDLSGVVRPGSVQASLLTGMLGIQPHPVAIEAVGWLAYVIPVAVYVASSPGRSVPARALAGVLGLTAILSGVAAAVFFAVAPGRPAAHPVTESDPAGARIVSRSAAGVLLEASGGPALPDDAGSTYRLLADGAGQRDGLRADVYRATRSAPAVANRPATLAAGEIARLNSGRLPIGLGGGPGPFPVTYRDVGALTARVDPRTDRILDLRWTLRTTASVQVGAGQYALPVPVERASGGFASATRDAAARAARADSARIARRDLLHDLAGWLTVLAGLTAAGGTGLVIMARQGRTFRSSGPGSARFPCEVRLGLPNLSSTDAGDLAMAHAVRATVPLVLAAAGLAGALAGCSSSPKRATAGSGAGSDPRVAAVTVTAARGCTPDRDKFSSGPITFTIVNQDATAVSEVELLSGERIIGEKENVPPGFTGQFAVNVPAGRYTLYCPGAATERTTIRVTGTLTGSPSGDVAALLTAATKGYARYVNTQVAALVQATGRLATALHGTDLGAARRAYMQARPFYEKIEPVAESFVIGTESIDADIDLREGGGPAATWRGFHRIEKALFQQGTLTGTGPYGDRLVADVKRLQKLTTGLTYQPTELANGAQELLDEVVSSKITGEEERYSHIDLLDVANNAEGAEQAFAQLQPALAKIDPLLGTRIRTAFAALDKLVDGYRTADNPSGFALYTTLTKTDKSALAAAVKAVQEPLSKVASKVATA